MNHRARRATAARLVLALAALAVALALAAPATALDERLDLRAGGGAIVPAGPTSSHFETGWQLNGGVGWAFDEAFGLRVDYTYSSERLIGGALSQGFVNGSHVMHGLEADARWTLTPTGPAPVYVLGGLGLYRQETAITRIRDYTPGPAICNPWLQVCAAPPVPVSEILGSRSSIDPGLDLGVGVEVPIRDRVRLVFEVRWRLVRGDAYGLPGQGASRAYGNYFPLTLAVRF